MSEHDDDLESVVREDADEETEAFPNTGDDLEEAGNMDTDEQDPELDEDEAEL